ncbi:hypothetical protein [Methylobacterium tardum]|uniref:hypothetical protein n=1 Tax=Methylobacterium tardum TaxID=374432 RepID=UPI0036232790
MTESVTSEFPLFLSGGMRMGAMMRSHDWSGSPLGHPDTWPPCLRSTVSLMLGSRFPMFVAFGPELGLLYNDAYVEILGDKHPAPSATGSATSGRRSGPISRPLSTRRSPASRPGRRTCRC